MQARHRPTGASGRSPAVPVICHWVVPAMGHGVGGGALPLPAFAGRAPFRAPKTSEDVEVILPRGFALAGAAAGAALAGAAAAAALAGAAAGAAAGPVALGAAALGDGDGAVLGGATFFGDAFACAGCLRIWSSCRHLAPHRLQ